jgi:3-oxoacyl-[acyl-carrier-protein] synthase-3
MKRINLVSIGIHVPDTILSNADLEKMVDTSGTWIRDRTGIRERRIAGPGVYSQDQAIAASRKCLAPQPSIRP